MEKKSIPLSQFDVNLFLYNAVHVIAAALWFVFQCAHRESRNAGLHIQKTNFEQGFC